MKFKYLVPIFFLLLASFVVSSVTLKEGEVYEIGNKELIVYGILSDKIKVNVDGVKNIIKVGEQKIVNGVDILVQSVFYDDLPEERTVDVIMSMAFYCGDGTCDTDQDETKENCCEDCGCNPGYVCSDKVCKTEAQVAREQEEEEERRRDACEEDIDCDDNDSDTEDVCLSKPGEANRCLNMPPICKTDTECDDQNPCTVDRCVSNDCVNTKVQDFVKCWEKRESQEVEEKEGEKENESTETPPQETIPEEPKVTPDKVSGKLIGVLVAVLVVVIGLLIMLLKVKRKQELPEEGFIKKN